MESAVLITIILSSTFLLTLLMRFCYSSKCKTIKCLGVLIERQISQEPPIDQVMNHNKISISQD